MKSTTVSETESTVSVLTSAPLPEMISKYPTKSLALKSIVYVTFFA